jgi:phosphatidylinositol glycan class B
MGWVAAPGRRLTVAAVLVLAAIPRVWLALVDQSIFWPDEIFQALEPAHKLVFGYGYVSWEFQEGARSWLFAGFLGLPLKLAALLGVTRGQTLVILVRLLMVAVSLVGVWAAMRLATVIAGARAGILAGVLGALLPAAVVFGGRPMSGMVSGTLLVVAALLTMGAGWRRLVAAGVLAGLAVFLRYQNGIVVAGLLLVVLARRGYRDMGWFAAAAAVVGLAGGLLDLATWGRIFHSFRVYVTYNFVEGKASEYGVAPASYYAQVFWSATGIATLVIVPGLVASWRRARGLLLVVGVYLLLHLLVPHKELRFLLPVVPLGLALTGVGLADLVAWLATTWRRAPTPPGRRGRGKRRTPAAPEAAVAPATATVADRVTWGLAALLVVVLGWHTSRVTFADLGQPTANATGANATWRENDDVNRLYWAAGTRPDLCGLALVAHGEVWTGGYAYLHRDVPIVAVSAPLAAAGLGPVRASCNYALLATRAALPPGYVEVDRRGARRLARRPGACGPPPAGYTRLFPQ